MDNVSPSFSAQANDKKVIPSDLRYPVVGLGASAGGLQALLRFFENMPPDNGMAFVVILHLSPDHPSNAAEILQAVTKMPVRQVTAATAIEPNHIYVIPPNKNLSMNDGYLHVTDRDRPGGKRIAIDLFFRALADVHKQRAVGIVLSGAGADGAVGLARIKEQGGVTFAQSLDDAEYSDMPGAAIDSGIVDVVLPVADMPQRLVALWSNARSLQLPPLQDPDAPVTATVPVAATKDAEEALQEVISLLRSHTGHDFRHYKRATVIRRIERRLQVSGMPTLPAYRDYLKANKEENNALLSDLLIGVTNFFRDREAFEAMENEVIPRLFEGKQNNQQVRAWVAASSTGEEAYSLAMLLADHAGKYSNPPEMQVFATDIDEQAIMTARIGSYPESIVTDISPPRLHQFFSKEDKRYRIKKFIRDMVLFASHNLLKDPPFSKLDLICCRNLLIYLNREVQNQLLELFHFALNPGGYLLLGSSESADAVAHLFTPVDKRNRIYRAKVLPHSTRYAPTIAMGPVTRPSMPDTAAPTNKRKFSFAEVHQRVLAQYSSPSVIVDHDSNIIHMSDRAGRFLRYIGGEPSNHLVSLVLPELRLELRTALFQTIQSRKSVEARRVKIKRDGRDYWVNMVARPFHDNEAAADFVLVLFDEVEETMSEGAEQSPDSKKDAVMTQLEEELQRTKEHLQETIEHSEVSTEELKASNEELQAINEELRSATEELETSKEELQSVNEELVTVNYELKMKVEETGKVNDDLNNLIASTDIATIFVDRGMRIKRYTSRATDIFSIIPSDVDRSLLDITHCLEYEGLADDAMATFESLRMIEREVRSNDGRLYISRMLPYRTTEDRIDGAIMTFIDITTLRQTEERLRAGEARMRLVAESTKDYAIITSDVEGCITSWNTGAERMYGYTEEEALGQKIDVIYTPEDIVNGVPESERRVAREGSDAEDERWHIRKDGGRIFCSGVMTSLHNDGLYGYAKIARDLTGRRHADSQREAQLAQAQSDRDNAHAEKVLKDQFLAVMSHELKQPLNLINISAELLTRLPEVRNSALGAKAVATIQRTVMSQAKIIDDLLDLSRVSTGKLALTMAKVDLAAAVNSIVGVIQGDSANRNLKISLTGTEEPVFIYADAVRVQQIVWNLVSNAVKFTPAEGNITVKLSKDLASARLDVIDTGQGIAPDFLPRVFDMFQQAGFPTTRSTGGLGIGLALVQQLVHLHGGRVEAMSDGLNRGSRFSVWLPLQEQSSANADSGSPAAQAGIAGLRILLIDDMEEAVEAFKLLLELEGAVMFSATGATPAFKILDENIVDLIVCDIAMPDIDGYAFIRELRAQPKYANVPAIAISGMARQTDIERAIKAGFSAYLGKPVAIEVLIEKISGLRGNLHEPRSLE